MSGFFQDQVDSIQIMNLLFLLSLKHNWLRIRSTDYTLYFYVSLLATPQPEHREP